jgi:hypothetical protein
MKKFEYFRNWLADEARGLDAFLLCPPDAGR